MKKRDCNLRVSFVFIILATLSLTTSSRADIRIIEFTFALSADLGSEYSATFPAFNPGRMIVEANWATVRGETLPGPMSLILLRPDGSEAARSDSSSPARLEYRATEPELDGFISQGRLRWKVKIINSSTAGRNTVEGRLRINIPTSSRILMDLQFTLSGSGNAQEIPFQIPAPGRIEIEAVWDADPLSKREPVSLPLTLSLIHPGQARTYARRQGSTPLRVERQVTESELDKGTRWIARIQNDNGVKIAGRLKVIFTPGL